MLQYKSKSLNEENQLFPDYLGQIHIYLNVLGLRAAHVKITLKIVKAGQAYLSN